jgi:methionyl-tRNA synthetase
MDTKNVFYLTTPIFYPNAKLHLGHAYTMTLADAIVRQHKVEGAKTYFLAGSDENTQKMIDAALKSGIEPKEFLDGIVQNFTKLYASLNISYDQFIRTTDTKVHWPGAQELWRRLVASGDIYKKEYVGLYCVGHEAFVTEKDLVDGKCPDHGTVPEKISEVNYFFRLSRYGDAVRDAIERNELRIVPETRKHEILSFITAGLEDVSFSRPRRVTWPTGFGIPVPDDDTQIMYVWCDALVNYITALGFGREDDALYKEFWPASVQVIGKDILRFHAAIWPAMLLSAGLPLPKALLVHGFITSGGKKMSKTLGNVIDPEELLAQYGTDAVRYYLLRHISPFEDGDLTREGFADAYQAHLTNGLGNLVARVMTLAEAHLSHPVTLTDKDTKIDEEYLTKFHAFRVNEALDYVFTKVAAADAFMTEQVPYKKIKSSDPSEQKAARDAIEQLVRDLASIAVHCRAALPHTAELILEAIRTNTKPTNLFPRL